VTQVISEPVNSGYNLGKANMTQSQQSLQEIWRQGCLGQTLAEEDETHFAALARSRFHTFDMSASHAGDTRSHAEAAQWVELLVKGLARELQENPGLERLWHQSTYSETIHGKSVSFALQTQTV